MIGICIKGKSPDGCITYILNDKKVKSESSFKDRSEVLVYNNCYGETKEIIGQFQQVMQLNKKLSDPILHIILSLAPGENLNSNQLVDLTYCCAQKFNFSDNIYLSAFHKDTIDRQHIHICASRIGYDKKTVSDSNDFKRMAEFCREMEIKFGLQKVLSPRAFLPKEQRDLPRYDKRKEFLKESIIGSLKEAENFEIFQIKMAEKGFKVLKSRGISFVDHEGVITKGSSVSYSLMKIESTLKSNQGDQEDVPKIRIRIPEKMSFEKSGFAILNDPQKIKILEDFVQQMGIEKGDLNDEGIVILNNENDFFIAMRNDSGGYCLRNKLIIKNIGEPDITTIITNRSKPTFIVDSMMDYLNLRSLRKGEHNFIILNSPANEKLAIQKIQTENLKPILLFLKNDEIGKSLIKNLRTAFPDAREIHRINTTTKQFTVKTMSNSDEFKTKSPRVGLPDIHSGIINKEIDFGEDDIYNIKGMRL